MYLCPYFFTLGHCNQSIKKLRNDKNNTYTQNKKTDFDTTLK